MDCGTMGPLKEVTGIGATGTGTVVIVGTGIPVIGGLFGVFFRNRAFKLLAMLLSEENGEFRTGAVTRDGEDRSVGVDKSVGVVRSISDGVSIGDDTTIGPTGEYGGVSGVSGTGGVVL